MDAIGGLSRMSEEMKRALAPDDLFQDIPEPMPADWLAENFEPGQRYADFLQERIRIPTKTKDKIYLQPNRDMSSSLEALKDCAEAYFSIEVRVLDPVASKPEHIRTRINRFTGKPQMRSIDIMKLLTSRLPSDAFCLLGITQEDLYPEEHWNFVFGEASSSEGVGIFSFARYDPMFYGEKWNHETSSVLLKRSCKVLVHETAHMYSLSHCIYFHCIMNGSNHLEESEARPFHFCPVCLRKLQSSTGIDIVAWYRRLLAFYNARGFAEESAWVEKRLGRITSGT
jgi:archaemetzincin